MFLPRAPGRPRSRLHRIGRVLLGGAAVILIVLALSRIPYDVLRQERLRLYGEIRTSGQVLALRQALDGSRVVHLVEYQYVDQDGLVRPGLARLPVALWARLRPADPIEVLYARSQPGLSRVPGEVETPFQAWLRRTLR